MKYRITEDEWNGFTGMVRAAAVMDSEQLRGLEKMIHHERHEYFRENGAPENVIQAMIRMDALDMVRGMRAVEWLLLLMERDGAVRIERPPVSEALTRNSGGTDQSHCQDHSKHSREAKEQSHQGHEAP